MAQRYCTTCGSSLPEDARFCGSCGSPAHRTAAVATPEADVDVPPVPTRPSPDRPARQGPGVSLGALTVMALALMALALMALALMAVFVTAARGGMSAAEPGDTFAFAVGLGFGAGVIVLALPVAVVLLVAAVYWLTARREGVIFGEAVFNWPMAILTGAIVFFGFLI